MTEILGIYAFIVDQLDTVAINAIVNRRIFADVAPPIDDQTKLAPAYPMIVFGVRTSSDLTLLGGESGYLTAIVDVKIITDDSIASIVALDALVFAALHRSGGIVENVEIMGCHRTNHLLNQRTDGDKSYRYSCQTYKIRAARIAPTLILADSVLLP